MKDPAFPQISCTESGYPCTDQPGMSLRDYFAAAALTGLLSNSRVVKSQDNFVVQAYQCADAMLTHREKEISK